MAVAVVISLLLVATVELAFHVQTVRADSAVYIRADGSVEPETAPILHDGDVYTLTGNITSANGGITVERSNVIIDGNGSVLQGSGGSYGQNGFSLFNVNNVTIKDTIIEGFYWGVCLNSTGQVVVSGNRIMQNGQDGIAVFSSSDNTVAGNNVTNNGMCGVWLDDSSGNSITGNNLMNNGSPGIWLNYSSNNSIAENFIAQNLWRGILLDGSSGNSIVGNNITNNEYGILLHQSSANNVAENNITNNNAYGIRVHISSDGNNITGNNLVGNPIYGIFIFYSSANTVSGNNITGNSNYGVRLDGSWDNSIFGNDIAKNPYGVYVVSSLGDSVYHNNLLNNRVQAYVTPGYAIAWNSSYPSGGNYWSDYAGSDLNSSPYQNETGSDELGDVPYIIGSANVDYYPLMRLWVPFVNQTIHINGDGTVDPSGAPIHRSGDSYSLTADVTSDGDGIVIDKDNATLSGSSYVLMGKEVFGSKGVDLSNKTGVTVRDMGIENFYCGIWLGNSSNSSIVDNNVLNSTVGIRAEGTYNKITRNTLVNSEILVENSNYSLIYHNNFVNASAQVSGVNVGNVWDNGVEGNYWSNYNGTDSDGDGVGDTCLPWEDVDYYPLVRPYVYADVNHDGLVNMTDISLCSNAFGSYPGHPSWNPHSDINEDGKVNMRDIGIACNNFMNEWSVAIDLA